MTRVRVLLFGLVLALGGCATNAVVTYPRFAAAPRVAVSTGTLSLMTEVPAGDYLIPDSHVFIGGRNMGTGGSAAFAVLGPIGAMAGMAVDQSRNQSAAGNAERALALRFDMTMRTALERTLADSPAASRPSLVAADGASDVLLVMSARFQAAAADRASVMFQS